MDLLWISRLFSWILLSWQCVAANLYHWALFDVSPRPWRRTKGRNAAGGLDEEEEEEEGNRWDRGRGPLFRNSPRLEDLLHHWCQHKSQSLRFSRTPSRWLHLFSQLELNPTRKKKWRGKLINGYFYIRRRQGIEYILFKPLHRLWAPWPKLERRPSTLHNLSKVRRSLVGEVSKCHSYFYLFPPPFCARGSWLKWYGDMIALICRVPFQKKKKKNQQFRFSANLYVSLEKAAPINPHFFWAIL